MRSIAAADQLREEDHVALETLLANVPQSHAVKSNSLELTPHLSPAATPANRRNRLPIGICTILYVCYSLVMKDVVVTLIREDNG